MNDQSSIIKTLAEGLHSKLSINICCRSPLDVASFSNNLLKLLRSETYQTNLTLSPFVLALDPENKGSGKNIFTSNLLNEFFKNREVKNCNIIFVDIKGNRISSKLSKNYIINNIEELNETFSTTDLIFFFIEGNSFDVVKHCKIFKTVSDIFSLQKTRAYKNRLPITEYRTLINNHFTTEIIGQKGFSYWENKLGRILVAKPEVNFRKRLAAFLSDYVGNGTVDQESLNASTDDRTDIRVTSFEDEVYIIEIKWIGECVTHNNYNGKGAHIRANEGIQQLEIYIQTELRCIKGILVVYDARVENEKIVWTPNKTKWNNVIDRNPFILYLDTKSASTKASKNVRNT